MPTKKVSKSGKKLSRSGYPGAPSVRNTGSGGEDVGQQQQQQHGILEGISSLHSWIKTQTMIRPAKLGPGGGGKREGYDDDDEEEEDDDIIIPLTSRDPNMSLTQVRWDHTMGEFLGFNFSEMMIDHLNIESTIHHVDSIEAQLQMEETNKAGGESEESKRTRYMKENVNNIKYF